jgi:hypothetical protein
MLSALVVFSIMAALFAIGLAANEITWGDMAIVATFVQFAVLFGMTWNSMVRARRERQRRAGKKRCQDPFHLDRERKGVRTLFTLTA